jgi:hypothetical protein
MACPVIVWDSDSPRVREFLPEYHLKQGGLALAVSSNKPNTFTGIDGKTGIFKDDLLTV